MLKTLLVYDEEIYANGIKIILNNIDSTMKIVMKQIDEDLSEIFLQDRFDYTLIIPSKNNIEDIIKDIRDYNDVTYITTLLDKPNSSHLPVFKKYNLTSIASKKLTETSLYPILKGSLKGEIYLPPELILNTTPLLSKCQTKILDGISRGLSNKQIAFEIGISETTVKTHIGNIMKKLDCYNRVGTFRKALELGLID